MRSAGIEPAWRVSGITADQPPPRWFSPFRSGPFYTFPCTWGKRLISDHAVRPFLGTTSRKKWWSREGSHLPLILERPPLRASDGRPKMNYAAGAGGFTAAFRLAVLTAICWAAASTAAWSVEGVERAFTAAVVAVGDDAINPELVVLARFPRPVDGFSFAHI